MALRDDAISAAKAVILQEQDQALMDGLGKCYDQGLKDQADADGSQPSPADQALIAQLQDQVAQLQAQDAADVKAGQDAVAAAQQSLSDLQAKFDALNIKEQGQEQALSDFGAKVDSLQAALDTIKGLLVLPAPAPAPAPSNP